jgi:hypothetical protein
VKNSITIGMGDLHRLEAGLSGVIAVKANTSRQATGFGDLHRLEAQGSSRQAPGMGDLHRFESK